MSPRFLTLTLLASTLSFAPAVRADLLPRKPAETPEAPAVPERPLSDEAIQKVLAQLAELQSGLAGKRTSYNASLLPRLREAAASNDKAFELWLDAVKDVDFEQKGKSATEFSDFRNGQAKKMRTSEFGLALQFQVRYLILLIQTTEAREDSARREAISATIAFLDDLTGSVKKLGGEREKLRQDALDGPIAKHLKLDVSIKKDERIAPNPGDLDQIYEKMILPFYREQRAATPLNAAWQKRIAQETEIVKEDKNSEALTNFQTERLPLLRWRQATDQYSAGQEEPAVAAMVALIKENLGHRNADKWIQQLTGLLEKGKQE